MGAAEIATPLLAALQASISVLLTIYVGVLVAQFQLLDSDAAKKISRTSITVFLPFLLITKIGNELNLESASNYVPILIWALFYNLFSMLVGIVSTKVFKLPPWVTPALAFNNTTSLPLLLISSLGATGILEVLLINPSDTAEAALSRAESYFLVNAMISNTFTFSLGPRLLEPHQEDQRNDKSQDEDKAQTEENEHAHPGGSEYPYVQKAHDVESGPLGPPAHDQGDSNAMYEQFDQQIQAQERGQTLQEYVDEESSLLPRKMIRKAQTTEREAEKEGSWLWSKIPRWLQTPLDILGAFLNPPLLGACVGALIGLVPSLSRLFFAETEDGGYFNAWLTKPMQNVGSLFATLQVIVVGVKLSQALRKLKKGEESGKIPWPTTAFITIFRLVLWPVVAIAIIWALATHTNVLGTDPVLWFTMMIMPTGPPAMVLVSLADVSGADEREKLVVAKFLTLSYALSPLLAFAVVGSLKASQAVVRV